VFSLYLVGENEGFKHIRNALERWRSDKPANAVIEITDSGVYVEPINITLHRNQTLQLRCQPKAACHPPAQLADLGSR